MDGICSICEHPRREEIETALLELKDVEQVADEFEVSIEDLKMHAMFHTPSLPSEASESLTRKIKLQEADMLAEVSQEYLRTLKTMGHRINKLATPGTSDFEEEERQLKIAKLLTKPMVDLYIGLGGEIRQTVKTMAELDQMLNGPKDNLGSGIAALAKAIQDSHG